MLQDYIAVPVQYMVQYMLVFLCPSQSAWVTPHMLVKWVHTKPIGVILSHMCGQLWDA